VEASTDGKSASVEAAQHENAQKTPTTFRHGMQTVKHPLD
jgi:hypothetical protein